MSERIHDIDTAWDLALTEHRLRSLVPIYVEAMRELQEWRTLVIRVDAQADEMATQLRLAHERIAELERAAHMHTTVSPVCTECGGSGVASVGGPAMTYYEDCPNGCAGDAE